MKCGATKPNAAGAYDDHVCGLPKGHKGRHKCWGVHCSKRWGSNRKGKVNRGK